MNGLLRAPAAAYVHIPFCLGKCSYCDFISYPGQTPQKRLAFSSALVNEIRLAAVWAARQEGDSGQPFLRSLKTVFFGGGTPTLLDAAELVRILDALDDGFGLDPDGEFTLEANPGTVSGRGLSICREAGFNRISFGLQAVQPALLKTLGRLHGPEDFLDGVDMALQAGFTSINADIIFGVPGQTLDHVSETLQTLLRLPVSHISFYSLSLEEGTRLQALAAANPALMPTEELERAQYRLICQTLQEHGFEHYEISNAARPGSRCRHNLVYWQGLPYYGFGAAAHSYAGGVRRANAAGLDEYIAAFTVENPAGCPPDAFAAAAVLERIDEQSAQKEMLFLGLRLLEGVRFEDFAARFGRSLLDCFGNEIRQLVNRGLLIQDEQGIRLSPAGLDLANQVFMEFI